MTPTTSAAIQEPTHRSVTRLPFSVTAFGRKPREMALEQPLSRKMHPAAAPATPMTRRRVGEPERTNGTFPEDG